MHQLDTSGYICPLPILKTQKALKSLQSGEQITIIATDPLTTKDLPIFCTEQGHILISTAQINPALWHFVVQKG